MQSIILVGNGSSLLDRKMGNEIDKFDKVVRFNSFKIQGFEEYTGIKTDIWFTVNGCHKNEINEFDEVIFHSWARLENCKMYADLKRYRDIKKIKMEQIQEIGINHPSTGLIAIFHFLKSFPEITITGFDWWNRKKHHYGDDEPRGTLHKPILELQKINSLGNQIKFL